MTNFDPSSYENEFVSVGKSVMKVLIFRWWFVDVCDNFAGGSQSDYNLELSLGSLSSKRSNLEQTDEEGSIGMDQRVPMAFESDWQRNTRPKVYIYIYILIIVFASFLQNFFSRVLTIYRVVLR